MPKTSPGSCSIGAAGTTSVSPPSARPIKILPIGAGRAHDRKIGDILYPVREPRHVLDQIKEDLRSRTFEAQYQQQPIPDQGGLVTWSWFATHNGQPQRGPYDTMVVSWDTAMKDRGVNDYSIGIVARVRGTRQVHILDVIRVRLDFPTLRKRIVEEARRHNATTLIEAACSGIPLIQDLYGQISIIQRQPLGDKAVRLHAVTPMIEAGQVFLPARAPWLDAFRRELLSFPGRRYDDQVDALSQLLGWVRERNSSRNLQTTYRTTRG